MSILSAQQQQLGQERNNKDQISFKFVLGADHAGYEMKEKVKAFLEARDLSYMDLGTDSEQSVDYPDLAKEVAQQVADSDNKKGILICGTGVGMSIAANKIKGIRAAVCYNKEVAEYAIKHNNANIFCFGARQQDWPQVRNILKAILNPKIEFEAGRHQRRVDKINNLDQN